jgi:hypothetical protein
MDIQIVIAIFFANTKIPRSPSLKRNDNIVRAATSDRSILFCNGNSIGDALRLPYSLLQIHYHVNYSRFQTMGNGKMPRRGLVLIPNEVPHRGSRPRSE